MIYTIRLNVTIDKEFFVPLNRIRFIFCLLGSVLLPSLLMAEEEPRDLLFKAKRVVFLGDSITNSGEYIAFFDAWLQSQNISSLPEVINIGLSSETVSGLSEEGHAGGQFPRPDLAERIDRVLKLARPDLVIACYGMNCGIYQPLDESRFEKYQTGMKRLRDKVAEVNAKIIHITPPCYDDVIGKRPFEYNKVLDRYSEWLIEQRSNGWFVIDLHFPMNKELEQRRMADAKFTFQPDAVHPNSEGHWFIAKTLIQAFGDASAKDWKSPNDMFATIGLNEKQFAFVKQRMQVLRDSYLSTAGHKRPGVGKGLPLDEAKAKASELTRLIHSK